MVALLDPETGTALTMDGQALPITDWADSCGEIVDDPDAAAYCMAGPDGYGRTWMIDVRRLEQVRAA